MRKFERAQCSEALQGSDVLDPGLGKIKYLQFTKIFQRNEVFDVGVADNEYLQSK